MFTPIRRIPSLSVIENAQDAQTCQSKTLGLARSFYDNMFDIIKGVTKREELANQTQEFAERMITTFDFLTTAHLHRHIDSFSEVTIGDHHQRRRVRKSKSLQHFDRVRLNDGDWKAPFQTENDIFSSRLSERSRHVTRLSHAAMQRKMGPFRKFLANCTKAEGTEEEYLGDTLVLLVEQGEKGAVEWLLQDGITPDSNTTVHHEQQEVRFRGPSALMIAIERDSLEMVKILCEREASVNSTAWRGLESRTGKTALSSYEFRPLDVAIQRGNPEIIALLREYGAVTTVEYKQQREIGRRERRSTGFIVDD